MSKNGRQELELHTFPSASKAASKNIMTPRNMNSVPNVVRATPISKIHDSHSTIEADSLDRLTLRIRQPHVPRVQGVLCRNLLKSVAIDGRPRDKLCHSMTTGYRVRSTRGKRVTDTSYYYYKILHTLTLH